MVESLEQLFETLEDFSNSIYIKAAEIKSMLVSKLDSEKQSDFLINYAKSIDLSNSYAKVFSELNKCLAFSDSDYSKKYDYFKKSGQTHKIERMEKLIRKNIPLDNINSCLMDIELGAKNENPFLPIIWNEKNCIGGYGYAGNYIKTNEGLYVCPDCAVIQENDVFGWLYWKKGLESAMIAHFSADIIIHVCLPLF